MSRSSTPEGPRGQADPLASLAAVAVLAMALGAYGLYMTDAVADTTDRSVEGPTLDRVWHAVGSEGTFDADEYAGDGDYEVGDPAVGFDNTDIEQRTLPQGRFVYVTVTTITDDGDQDRVAEQRFNREGRPSPGSRPDDVDRKTRPVPVRLDPGTVTGGQLTVEVWG